MNEKEVNETVALVILGLIMIALIIVTFEVYFG
jgi:hypothetical protein